MTDPDHPDFRLRLTHLEGPYRLQSFFAEGVLSAVNIDCHHFASIAFLDLWSHSLFIDFVPSPFDLLGGKSGQVFRHGFSPLVSHACRISPHPHDFTRSSRRGLFSSSAADDREQAR